MHAHECSLHVLLYCLEELKAESGVADKKNAFALKRVQKQVLEFSSAMFGTFASMHPVDRGDAAVIQRAKCTNGEVFLGNVCISFNGDLKLYVNMPKRRIFSGTRAVKTSGNALSSCENTMRLNDMESTGFLFLCASSAEPC